MDSRKETSRDYYTRRARDERAAAAAASDNGAALAHHQMAAEYEKLARFEPPVMRAVGGRAGEAL